MKKVLFGFLLLHLWTPVQGADNTEMTEKKDLSSLNLMLYDQKINIDFNLHPELIEKKHQHFLVINSEKIPLDIDGALLPSLSLPIGAITTEYHEKIAPERLKDYFESSGLLGTEQEEVITIEIDENDHISFSGKPQSGYKINYASLSKLINEFDPDSDAVIRVPAVRTHSQVEASELLNERGIREIIGVGESNFSGSSHARTQNIKAALRKFNGLIVKKGETFSFNSILRDVKKSDGFVEELVIKGDKTEKELGGGVCQVSTTAYRAALYGGLPITGRRNHSYAVPYYKPHGIDATIYLGGQDFTFTNDTPGDVLLQGYILGERLYFVFYGTKDDRKVFLEGPFFSGYQEAPKAKVVYTTELPPGATKVVSNAHDGFTTRWIRRVFLSDGTENTETIKSYYKPWPAKILKGSTPTKALSRSIAKTQAIAPINIPPANQFNPSGIRKNTKPLRRIRKTN